MVDSISHSRWFLKKAARKGLANAAWASGWLAAKGRLTAGPRLRVLTYHRFGDAARDPFCVTRHDFELQMRGLAESGLAVSLGDLEAFLAGKRDLRDGAVLVTVDDGFRSVYTEMLPVLKRFAVAAVAYITPSLVRPRAKASRPGTPAGTGSEEYLTWDELEHLASEGVVIGSHGWTHRSLGRMRTAEVHDEAVLSRDTLQRRLGIEVTSIAYPYGTRADFNATTAAILAEAGYTTAFTSQHGAIVPGDDPLELPRIKVEGGESPRMFRLICRGAMDGWRLVDRALWRVQRAEGRAVSAHS